MPLLSMASASLPLLRAAAAASARPLLAARAMSSGDQGHIRDAGGAFAEKEKALENQYFRKEQQRQLENLKSHLTDEIKEHEDQIKRLQESIKRHQEKIKEMEKK